MLHYIIADTHFHNGDPRTDESLRYRERFIRFLDYIISDSGFLHILGDFLELWKRSIDENVLLAVLSANDDIFKLMRELKSLKIYPGNHDAELAKMPNTFFWQTMDFIEVLEIGGRKILMHHGHFWDIFNTGPDPIGKSIARLIGVIEKAVYPEIDDQLSRLVGTYQKTIHKGALNYANWCDCDAVIYGHTHQCMRTDIEKNNKIVDIVNIGSGIKDPVGQPYLTVDDQDGYIEMRMFN